MSERTERELILFRIAEMNEHHAKTLEPYIKRLVEIASLDPTPPVIVDVLMLDPDILARARAHLEGRP